jgi:hypothetical protein
LDVHRPSVDQVEHSAAPEESAVPFLFYLVIAAFIAMIVVCLTASAGQSSDKAQARFAARRETAAAAAAVAPAQQDAPIAPVAAMPEAPAHTPLPGEAAA